MVKCIPVADLPQIVITCNLYIRPHNYIAGVANIAVSAVGEVIKALYHTINNCAIKTLELKCNRRIMKLEIKKKQM